MEDALAANPRKPERSAAALAVRPVGEVPDRADADLPRWLREAFERRGIAPWDGLPPAHHLLTERDLPSTEDEDERVSIHTVHHALTTDLWPPLEERYQNRQDVFAATDLLVYYGGVVPSRRSAARISPDLLVAFGVPKRERGSFTVWEEGKAPDFVLEIVSPSTGLRHRHDKPGLYQRMGVRDYFLFDPRNRTAPLLAWRLTREAAVPLPPAPSAAGMAGVRSAVLGLELCHTSPWPLADHHLPEAGRLRWRDPDSGRLLETRNDLRRSAAKARERAAAAEARPAEEASARRAAEARAAEEASARRAAEARLAALEARLRR